MNYYGVNTSDLSTKNLDADERAPPELAAEISGVVAPTGNDGFLPEMAIRSVFVSHVMRKCS